VTGVVSSVRAGAPRVARPSPSSPRGVARADSGWVSATGTCSTSRTSSARYCSPPSAAPSTTCVRGALLCAALGVRAHGGTPAPSITGLRLRGAPHRVCGGVCGRGQPVVPHVPRAGRLRLAEARARHWRPRVRSRWSRAARDGGGARAIVRCAPLPLWLDLAEGTRQGGCNNYWYCGCDTHYQYSCITQYYEINMFESTRSPLPRVCIDHYALRQKPPRRGGIHARPV
jgi:hypothetical protein